MIQTGDFDRLVTEIGQRFEQSGSETPIDDWAETNGIDAEAFQEAVAKITMMSYHLEVDPSMSMMDALQASMNNTASSVMMAFILGWEIRDQYSKPK